MKLNTLLALLVLLNSCDRSAPNKEKLSVSSSLLLKDINLYESLIPGKIKDGSLFIWRVGSIEWSTDASVLVFPEKDKLNHGNCYYIQFNFDPKFSKENEEIMRIYHLSIQTDIGGFRESDLNFRPLDYVIHNGEGYCSNQYFIKKAGNDSMSLINSNAILSKKTMAIFKQISAQEHFQSLSLLQNCTELRDFADSIMFNKGNVASNGNYLLPYTDPVRYSD